MPELQGRELSGTGLDGAQRLTSSIIGILRISMSKATDMNVVEASTSRQKFTYRSPMKFGGREVTDMVLQRAIVRVTGQQGATAIMGVGEMPMGTSWAWPSKKLTADQVLRIVVALSDRIAARLGELNCSGHSIEIGVALQAEAKRLAEELAQQLKLPEPIPDLAILLALSPVDAAIHDAYGKLHQRNSFRCVHSDYLEGDLSRWLGPDFVGKTFDDEVLSQPKPTLSLYHLVGASDSLSPRELAKPMHDGLPETLEEWIATEGLTHLKIKMSGTDLDWDVGRVIEIERLAILHGHSREWRFSLDFNECCPNEDYVIDFLERAERLSKTVVARIQYIEQPTHRDLKARRDITMHRVSRIKPVVIDESLVDLESVKVARQLGYTGIALKTCKGMTESLLLAAAARHYGMFVCVQDLTCVGSSFLHSAAMAAHFPQ